MINHPEGLWQAAKKAYFPSLSGDEDRKLRLMFFQALWAGRELVTKSLDLDNRTCVDFNKELKEQIISALKELGHNPVRIDLGTQPKQITKVRINGEEV